MFMKPNRNHWLLNAWACLLAAGGWASAKEIEIKNTPILSDWAALVDTNAPLPEYPRPQMVRSEWMNLNGVWQFQAGETNDAVPVHTVLKQSILVPFPMESTLSGIVAYHPHSWYRRTFTVPAKWKGQRVLLHLDAVDWESEPFINGQSLGIHRGGYDPATYDLTPCLSGKGPQELIVRVYDPTDSAGEPRGKQSLNPGGIMYTSCSGIWQSAWLEPVPAASVDAIKLVPDIDQQQLKLTVKVAGAAAGLTIKAVARKGDTVVGSISGLPGQEMILSVTNPILWCPTNPFLYDLSITLAKGKSKVDSVESYFGMRKISLAKVDGFLKILLNNQFVFQMGPLDQGFWPDGIYRAPTDDALKSDIEQMKLIGFNMIRKHIKVESARWYYWTDKLGMLVWQDMPSINSYTMNPKPVDTNEFKAELSRVIRNRWNAPSIVVWVAFNEAQGQRAFDTAEIVQQIRDLDPSRLVNQASGGDHHGVGDLFDIHPYPEPALPKSTNQATVNGEFGGVGLYVKDHTWAFGKTYVDVTDNVELMGKFQSFCVRLNDYVLSNGLSAAVYTQTTDVETELNGLLTYDRKVRKVDVDFFRRCVASVTTPNPFAVSTVVPTSQREPLIWKYTTTAPATNWTAAGFEDAAWAAGPAGFGGGNLWNASVRTEWKTPDIWLRRTFTLGDLTPQQLHDMQLNMYHDDGVEVYVNGVCVYSTTGFRGDYGYIMSKGMQTALQPNATNLLAVHCHDNGGARYIDVGLSDFINHAVIPTRPVPATPAGLKAAAGKPGVTLGWNAAAEASRFNVKRARSKGGPYTVVASAPMNCVSDATVQSGQTYYYVVSAVNSSGESQNSPAIKVTVRP